MDGGFFFTGKENEQLIARNKEIYDGAIPSGNSVAALNLLRLGRMTGKTEFEEKAERMFQAFGSSIAPMPKVYTQFLNAVDFLLGPNREIVIAGNPEAEMTRSMVELIQRRFMPRTVVASGRFPGKWKASNLAPFIKDMKHPDEGASAYICERYTCSRPLTNPEDWKRP